MTRQPAAGRPEDLRRDLRSAFGIGRVAPRSTIRVAAMAILGALLELAASTTGVAAVEQHAAVNACQLEAGPSRAVTRVIDGESLALDDGSEVKLLGILAPRALDTTATTAAIWPPERDAVATLSALVLGRSIELAFANKLRNDRYGRLLAHAFVDRDGARTWVQGHMLSQGHGRAHALAGNAACLDALLAHERPARDARLGLWSNAAYHERSAYRTRELMRLRNTFQVVAGRVRTVVEKKGVLLLNFGRDWNDDFTVGIKTGKLLLEASGGADAVRGLENRQVRVRGWIERRNGPYIELSHASEIEVLDMQDVRKSSRIAPTDTAATGGGVGAPPSASSRTGSNAQQERPER